MVLIHDQEFGIWRFDSHIHSFCTVVYDTVGYYTSMRYDTSTGEYSIVDDVQVHGTERMTPLLNQICGSKLGFEVMCVGSLQKILDK